MMEPLLELSVPRSRDLVLTAVGSLLISGVVGFLLRLYQVRMMVRRVQSEHGVVLIKHKVPPDSHGLSAPLVLMKEFPEVENAGLVYLDAWPINSPIIAVFHPEMMAQFTQDISLRKHPLQVRQFKPFTNGEDLVNTEGQEWRNDQTIFSPGFAIKNLMALIPAFVEEVLVFKEKLRKAAERGEVVKLEDFTTLLSVDVVGRAVLGAKLKCQEKPPRLLKALLRQISMLYFELDLRKQLNPLSPIRHWFLHRTFRKELMPYIHETMRDYEKTEGPKTILNLAVKSYVEEIQDKPTTTIPPDFLERIVNHTKMFLFAGHDTTATSMAYALYELGQNPDKAARLRAELNEVLGPNPSEAASRIAADPSLLNQLPYTLGVVKETLRLWPPVGTVRLGERGLYLRHPGTGARYPTEGFMLFSCSKAVHRHPAFWHRPDAFMPERFVHVAARDGGAASDPLLHPVRNAFRPWELGPRNCIGQELASLEIRLVLALTAREFDVEACYAEGAPAFYGCRAYQVDRRDTVNAHAKDGLPVRVRGRSGVE